MTTTPELLCDLFPNPTLVDALAEFGHLISDQSQKTALDAGCGPGDNALFLALQGFSVSAIDHNPDMIGKLNNRARQFGLTESITAQRGDICRPCNDCSPAELVVATGVLTLLSIAERQIVLPRLMCNTLPGGLVVADALERVSGTIIGSGMRPSELRGYFDRAGWTILRCDTEPNPDQSSRDIAKSITRLVAQRS